MQPDFDPIVPARVEWRAGTPEAPGFGDAYFSREDGPGESRAVFIDGNHLPRRFEALPPDALFVIGETGFGTGLNVLLAAAEFARRAPASARLALLSAEKHPLVRADLERALAGWPPLKPLSDELLDQYPPATPGFHRVRLADNVDLTLMFGDAAEMWRRQRCEIDAWFLDGFAPDRNPDMWSPRLLGQLAAHSRPGTTLATFTVAGGVRRALAGAGFALGRRPGFGRKRERLEGRLPGEAKPRHVRRGRALVIGAGLAGASAARTLAERGWRVDVIDRTGIAAGGSGNRAGVVYTTPSGIATPQNRFYQSSFLHAVRRLEHHEIERRGIGRLNGVVQHVINARQRRRLASALASGHWPETELGWIGDDAVLIARGGYLRPECWCRLLLDHPAITFGKAAARRLDREGRVELAGGAPLTADAVVLCTAAPVEGTPALPLRFIRGQVTECRATAASGNWRRAHCHDGYLTPAVDGVHLVGATFDLHDSNPEPTSESDAANLAALKRRLPERWRQLGGDGIEIVGRRVAFRVRVSDYLPVAGLVPASVNGGGCPLALSLAHGSRGIANTPLAAELIADRLSGLPPPADRAIEDALSPARFITRPDHHP